MMKLKPLMLIATVSVLTACSSAINPETGVRDDPLEGFNRAMWKVNHEYLDPYILKPAATAWRDYVPTPVRVGLTNVANNLDEPTSFVSRLLEGEGRQAMVHFNRFWINTVFGLGGLIDWASKTDDLKLTNGDRSFGHTLGTYGVGNGSYIMLPAAGPITPRQAVGKAVDSSYPLLSLLNLPAAAGKFVVQGLDGRSKLLGQEALLNSGDSYITVREAYFQNLDFKVNDGKMKDEVQETLSEEELKDID